jgi:hypothetical protein
MALTIGGGVRSSQGRATKIGSGDPAPLVEARIDDHGRCFIVVFATVFNRQFAAAGRALFERRQNGFTTANTTIRIISTVGASFKIR